MAVNNHMMETRNCSDLEVHIDSDVDSCVPETGTNEATGSAHRRRHGDPSHRVLSCLSSCEHDNLSANDHLLLCHSAGDANDFAIVRVAVFSLEYIASATVTGRKQSFSDACGVDFPSESAPHCAGSDLRGRHFYIGSDVEDGGGCSVTHCKDAHLGTSERKMAQTQETLWSDVHSSRCDHAQVHSNGELFWG